VIVGGRPESEALVVEPSEATSEPLVIALQEIPAELIDYNIDHQGRPLLRVF
jgi:DNA-directed RNA polymerase subunit K/omega